MVSSDGVSKPRKAKHMKAYIASSVFLLLVGCGTAATKTYLPGGEEGYAIDCSSLTSEPVDCYKKAGNVCGSRGYEVMSVSEMRLSSSALLIKCK